MPRSRLHLGDNLNVLREHVRDGCVHLAYLDPPFKSNARYSLRPARAAAARAAPGTPAFDDTWRWNAAAEAAWEQAVTGGGPAAPALRAFRSLLGPGDLLAYLSMMAPRLVEVHRVLAPEGTAYLHCDPTASHYLKVLLDAVFTARGFRNEIAWCYAGGGTPRRDFPRKHDVLLRYCKGLAPTYRPAFRPYSPGTVERGRTAVKGKYHAAGLRPEGTPVNDWWTDVPKLTSPTDPERLGYPTQKPEALLERLIAVSSREGETVLDPFCGSGTTLAVAQRMGRAWIGIDAAPVAIALARARLDEARPGCARAGYDVVGTDEPSPG